MRKKVDKNFKMEAVTLKFVKIEKCPSISRSNIFQFKCLNKILLLNQND